MRKTIYFTNKIPHFIFAILLISISLYNLRKVNFNWDVVLYMASVNSLEENDNHKVLAKTWDDINQSKYLDQKETYPKDIYGKTILSNPDALKEQYPFYKVRVLYLFSIYLFSKIITDFPLAIYLNSLLYGILSIITAYFFLYKVTFSKILAFASAAILALLSSFRDSVTSSPDSMSYFFLLLVVWFYSQNKYKWYLLFSIASILVRTDNIIFISLLNLFIPLNRKFKPKHLLFFILPIVAYYSVNYFYHNPGTMVLLKHTYIKHLSFPISHPETISFVDIKRILLSSIVIIAYPVLYTLLYTVIFFKNSSFINMLKNYSFQIIIIIAITFAIRLLLFLSVMPRFYFQFILISLFGISLALNKFLKNEST